MAKLYRPDGPPQGEPVEPIVGSDGIDVAGIHLPYEGLAAHIGGYEDSFLIFEHPAVEKVELWTAPEFLDRLPESVREQFAGVRKEQKAKTASRSRWRWGTAAVFTALLVWFFTGGLTSMALQAIPYSLEQQLGDMAAEEFASQAPECQNELLTTAVTEIMDRLVAQMDEVNYEYRVRVLMSDEVNAFALPGGEMFFYSGLLVEAGSEHEVAAVMGHEINHVVRRHGLRGMVQKAGVSALFALILGDASQGLQVLGGYAAQAGGLKHGRDQEREADILGVALMAKAQFDPQGAVDFFGRLAEATGDDGGSMARLAAMASTHPASTERQERLAELAQELTPAAPRGLDTEWLKIRGLCSP
jgi:predicted Zn-dependent protease